MHQKPISINNSLDTEREGESWPHYKHTDRSDWKKKRLDDRCHLHGT